MTRVEVRAEGICKTFAAGSVALDDVSFRARPGEVLTLLGPSGCGKSTLLRIVAGLERADRGRIFIADRCVDADPPGRRGIGFVFQNYALYPHLTVERNLSLALEARGLPREEIRSRVRETARWLDIETLLPRRPRQLSGGQQQRVALGRALAPRPRLYLMDEPLSNLDALLRESMRGELKRVFRHLGATVLYVTHDQGEAMSLSHQVLVLHEGRVRQIAPPLELYARPADVFTAGFIGSPRMSLWRGERRGDVLFARGATVALPHGLGGGGELWAGIRPEDVEVARESVAGAQEGRLEMTEPQGGRALLSIRIGEESVRALVRDHRWPERVWVRIPPEKLHCFDAASERRLDSSGGRSS